MIIDDFLKEWVENLPKSGAGGEGGLSSVTSAPEKKNNYEDLVNY